MLCGHSISVPDGARAYPVIVHTDSIDTAFIRDREEKNYVLVLHITLHGIV